MSRRPNILLLTADDMNYDALGVTGSRVADVTPNLDKLAADGMRFDLAHVTISVCMPSRSVLMTGRYPHRNGALGFEPIDEAVPTLPEQLAKAGYYNGIIGKESHLAPRHKFSWHEYIGVMDEEHGFGRDPEVYYAEAKRFMQQAQSDGKPWFLMANSHDPHRPFAGTPGELRQFGRHTKVSRTYLPEDVEVPGFLPDLPEIRQEIAEYYTSVHRCDESIGRILQALEETGEAEHTLVVFMSDNGMAFPFAKTNCYLNSTKTPLIVRWPNKVTPGAVDRSHFVSGIDYMATMLEAAGLAQPEGMDGTSYLPLLLGAGQSGREQVFTVFNRTSQKKDYPMRCLQNSRFGYIYNAWSDQSNVFSNGAQNGATYSAMRQAAQTDEAIADRVKLFEYRVKEELYDFAADPHALTNLIDQPEHTDTIQTFRRQLWSAMKRSDDFVTDQFAEEIFGDSHVEESRGI